VAIIRSQTGWNPKQFVKTAPIQLSASKIRQKCLAKTPMAEVHSSGRAKGGLPPEPTTTPTNGTAATRKKSGFDIKFMDLPPGRRRSDAAFAAA
jgi:hypothetical protein